MTTSQTIKAAKKKLADTLATDAANAKRYADQEKRKERRKVSKKLQKSREAITAAIAEQGGEAGILARLTDHAERGLNFLDIHLPDEADTWIEYDGRKVNPLAGLFKKLEKEGFTVKYQSGWANVDTGRGWWDEGEYWPDLEERRVRSPRIDILFPREKT